MLSTHALFSVSTLMLKFTKTRSRYRIWRRSTKSAGVTDIHIVEEMGNQHLFHVLFQTQKMSTWFSLVQQVSMPLNASWLALHLSTFSAMQGSIYWSWKWKNIVIGKKEPWAPFLFVLIGSQKGFKQLFKEASILESSQSQKIGICNCNAQ